MCLEEKAKVMNLVGDICKYVITFIIKYYFSRTHSLRRTLTIYFITLKIYHILKLIIGGIHAQSKNSRRMRMSLNFNKVVDVYIEIKIHIFWQ